MPRLKLMLKDVFIPSLLTSVCVKNFVIRLMATMAFLMVLSGNTLGSPIGPVIKTFLKNSPKPVSNLRIIAPEIVSASIKALASDDVITTTSSGLQYKVLTAGSGIVPGRNSTVEIHYVGRLFDGTEFDNTIKRGMPLQVGVTRVIAGLTEALQLMPEGSKWELHIPPHLAYGSNGLGQIGPSAILIFEVELLKYNVWMTRVR